MGILVYLMLACYISGNISKPSMTLTGPDSKIIKQDYERITSQKKLHEVWLRHYGDPKFRRDEIVPLLNVDFSLFEVICIFLGKKIEVDSLSDILVFSFNDEIVLNFRTSPVNIEGAGSLTTTPYGFVIIPRSNKRIIINESLGETPNVLLRFHARLEPQK